MPRPDNLRETRHNCCGNCVFSHWPKYKDHLLCFHGEVIEIEGEADWAEEEIIYLADGRCVSDLDGDEYSEVWAVRMVNPFTDICDQWQKTGKGNDGGGE